MVFHRYDDQRVPTKWNACGRPPVGANLIGHPKSKLGLARREESALSLGSNLAMSRAGKSNMEPAFGLDLEDDAPIGNNHFVECGSIGVKQSLASHRPTRHKRRWVFFPKGEQPLLRRWACPSCSKGPQRPVDRSLNKCWNSLRIKINNALTNRSPSHLFDVWNAAGGLREHVEL